MAYIDNFQLRKELMAYIDNFQLRKDSEGQGQDSTKEKEVETE